MNRPIWRTNLRCTLSPQCRKLTRRDHLPLNIANYLSLLVWPFRFLSQSHTCDRYVVTLPHIGKRSESFGRKASDPTPVIVITGRVAGLHLVVSYYQVSPWSLCCRLMPGNIQMEGGTLMTPNSDSKLSFQEEPRERWMSTSDTSVKGARVPTKTCIHFGSRFRVSHPQEKCEINYWHLCGVIGNLRLCCRRHKRH
jgi:hypothetical protein